MNNAKTIEQPSYANDERAQREAAASALRKYEWLFSVRPAHLAEILKRVLLPSDRYVFTSRSGTRVLVDPLSNLGRWLVEKLSYEPEIESLLQRVLKPGMTFVDIGANEGYFSALAANAVGDDGTVVAVEPQGRLQWLIESNVRLNSATKFVPIHAAIGEVQGTATLHLAPLLNHGSSSFLKVSKYWMRTEAVRVLTAEDVFDIAGLEAADLIKVDVEGFEDAVIRSMGTLCRAGRVRRLLVDYHEELLRRRGLHRDALHARVLESGMVVEEDVRESGYVLYRSARLS